jgi:hypothetical protein
VNRLGACLAVVLTGGGLFALLTSVSYYLEVSFGFSPLRVGLAFVPLALALLIGALVSARPLSGAAPARRSRRAWG